MGVKDDERQLWDAVAKARPDDHGLVYAWPIAKGMGMAVKRCEYLCRKWHKQGRVSLYGTWALVVGERDHRELSKAKPAHA